jgi:hypothetical protein
VDKIKVNYGNSFPRKQNISFPRKQNISFPRKQNNSFLRDHPFIKI